MPKYIELPYALENSPPPFEGNDIKSPESLSRYVVEQHTLKDGKVFDPFAGLGTNMFVAEELGRTPYGCEADTQRYEWVAGQLENWMNMICDDAGRISGYDLPKMDLITTCPPFMERNDKWNPLYGGDPKYDGYDKYLRRLKFIFSKLPAIMKKNTPLIVQVDNIQSKKGFTPLVHDMAYLLKRDFIQTDETIVWWDSAPKNYPFTTLLELRKR